MTSVDSFSLTLLEEAKRFLEKADSASNNSIDCTAYCHAALVLGYSSLEAHLNSLADELLLRTDLQVLDRSVLAEKDFELVKGEWKLRDRLRMYRLEDRLLYIFSRFSAGGAPTTAAWWGILKEGLDARNRLAHPREKLSLGRDDVRRYLGAVVECLNALFLALFRKGHPAYNRQLNSSLSF